jgi:hypothetical protein
MMPIKITKISAETGTMIAVTGMTSDTRTEKTGMKTVKSIAVIDSAIVARQQGTDGTVPGMIAELMHAKMPDKNDPKGLVHTSGIDGMALTQEETGQPHLDQTETTCMPTAKEMSTAKQIRAGSREAVAAGRVRKPLPVHLLAAQGMPVLT